MEPETKPRKFVVSVEEAKKKLLGKVKELEKEKADKELRSFVTTLEVKPEYHPKIIGRRGAVITKLRDDFDVNIQLPKKDDGDDSIITITGYESNAIKAKEAILKIVNEYVRALILSDFFPEFF